MKKITPGTTIRNQDNMTMDIKCGDVILATIQFTDTLETKTRPAVVLFKEYDNVIIAGITSNLHMKGIPLSVEEGAIKPSIIKLNYIFTISEVMIKRKLFSLRKDKKNQIYYGLISKLVGLKQAK
ncbi:MAG: type II toxin-antitoxin system PemK/MazF family toxin [Promethearchaeota archaeon]